MSSVECFLLGYNCFQGKQDACGCGLSGPCGIHRRYDLVLTDTINFTGFTCMLTVHKSLSYHRFARQGIDIIGTCRLIIAFFSRENHFLNPIICRLAAC